MGLWRGVGEPRVPMEPNHLSAVSGDLGQNSLMLVAFAYAFYVAMAAAEGGLPSYIQASLTIFYKIQIKLIFILLCQFFFT